MHGRQMQDVCSRAGSVSMYMCEIVLLFSQKVLIYVVSAKVYAHGQTEESINIIQYFPRLVTFNPSLASLDRVKVTNNKVL